jgi:hypothetical protein
MKAPTLLVLAYRDNTGILILSYRGTSHHGRRRLHHRMLRRVHEGHPEASFAQASSISLFRLISVLNVFSRSPVFRDAIAIGADKQTDDRKLALDDRFQSLLLMFDLMETFARRKKKKFKEHPSSAYIDIPVLADKYDVLWLPWVMRGHLWEAIMEYHSGRAFFIYEIAFKLKWRTLAVHAVRQLDGWDVPTAFTVEEAEQLGVNAYHCLIAAAEAAGSGNWEDIADNIELPEE